MTLGLVKDSVVDLCQLAELSKDDSDLDITPLENEGQTFEECIKIPKEPEPSSDLSTLRKQRSLAYDKLLGGGTTIYESFEQVSFYDDGVAGTGMGKKTFCCFVPWLSSNKHEDEDEHEDEDDFFNESAEPHFLECASPEFSQPVSGILRSASVRVPVECGLNAPRKRTFLPKTYKGRTDFGMYHVHFNPMSRVAKVRNRYSMRYEERLAVWWQRSDFEEFKKTNAILARGKNNSTDKSPDGKWWHAHGHTRRGLEKLSSREEAAGSLAKMKESIRAVLNEQRNQKRIFRNDPERLGEVAREYSTWSCNLARAAGASDRNAVLLDFDEKRKTREFYLVKQALAGQKSVYNKHTPAFMVPVRLPPRKQRALDGENVTLEKIRDPNVQDNPISKKAAAFGAQDAMDIAP